MITLNSPISELKNIGPSNLSKLKRLGITDVASLLFAIPFRYDNYGEGKKISDLVAGETANISGVVEIISNRRARNRRMNITEAIINDGSGTIKATWFNQPYLAKTIKVGDEISLAGKIQENWGQPVMASPQYEKLSHRLHHTKGLVPVYHSVDSLSQKQWHNLVLQALPLAEKIPDWLPAEIEKRLGLPHISKAIKIIHQPKDFKELEDARSRLAFGELFLRQLRMAQIRQELSRRKSYPMMPNREKMERFSKLLPFSLTNAQKRCVREILEDMKKNSPMNRLLQGDVGSGKTVVAAIAILNAVSNGYRTAIMAPTTILASQHHDTFRKLLEPLGISVSLLTGTKKEAIGDLVVGTQALVQKKVKLDNLGLVIIDEQHRFGVGQRENMPDQNKQDEALPHFLSMTATPIPRSLALTIYGDLQLSVIDEMPKDRKKIITKIIPAEKRPDAYRFIREELDRGGQAFIICPLIDQSDKLGVKSVKEEFERLGKEELAGYKLSSLNGKMKPKEKEKIMDDFSKKNNQVLISTSVIEVGIDIPNATIMAIEGASRFGLSQLHQFRGRVGRGKSQSYCLLLEEEGTGNKKTKDRLAALEKYDDGRQLAEMDLKLRGHGRIYGLQQSGFDELKVASIFDYEMIRQARLEAEKLIKSDPKLEHHRLILAKMNNEFAETSHLE